MIALPVIPPQSIEAYPLNEATPTVIGCASKKVNPSAIANSFHTQIPFKIAVATIPGIIRGK